MSISFKCAIQYSSNILRTATHTAKAIENINGIWVAEINEQKFGNGMPEGNDIDYKVVIPVIQL